MQLLPRFLFLLLACFTLTATAQPRESVEGIHYFALPKVMPTEWRNTVVGDRAFVRMPAVWNDLMGLHARIYYTGIALDAEDRIHQAAFRAIQEQNNPLRTEAQIAEFFIANGVDAAAFATAWNSETVTTAVQQATLRTADYGIEKLPSVIMNGRYMITHNAAVFNHIELNIAVNNVVRTMRDERRNDF